MSALRDKVIIVTGAGRGIGRAIAHRCASEGASVVAADFGGEIDRLVNGSPQPANVVATEIAAQGGRAVAMAANIATMAGAQNTIDAALEHFGRLDGMVCAAGLYNQSALWEMPEQDWDDVIASHLKGHFACYGKTLRASERWELDELAQRFESEIAPDLALEQFPWPPP